MIRLTRPEAAPLYVNPQHVADVRIPGEDQLGCQVIMSYGSGYLVKESAEDVVAMIEQATGERWSTNSVEWTKEMKDAAERAIRQVHDLGPAYDPHEPGHV